MVVVVRNMLFALMLLMGVAVLYKTASDDSSTRVAAGSQPERPVPGVEPARLSSAAASLTNQLILKPGRNGQYMVTAQVQGVDVRFLVDTGASSVVLTMEDAERVGLDPVNLTYSQVFQTANGHIRAAPVTLDGIRIGLLEVDGVEASVNESPMGISLLGMTFLSQLDGYQVENGDLVLYW